MIDLTGEKFNYLLVLSSTQKRCTGSIVWKCRCTLCKNITYVSARNLKNNHTKSCGCYKTEALYKANFKHGASKLKKKEGSCQLDYVLWRCLRGRCYDRTNNRYSSHGGRGIKVCEAWNKDFSKFATYIRTLPNCPKESLLTSRLKGKRLKVSIDRIKNSGNYEPGNIKWSTPKEQANNRRDNKLVVYNGETLTLAETVDKYSKHKYNTVFARYTIYGWSLNRALLQPIHKKTRKIKLFKRRNQ